MEKLIGKDGNGHSGRYSFHVLEMSGFSSFFFGDTQYVSWEKKKKNQEKNIGIGLYTQ
jgi:hypothetical protein